MASSIIPIPGPSYGSNDDKLPWFALYVRPRHEKRTSYVLEEKGFQTFLPTYITRRRWVDRVKTVELPLFPQYIFCRLSESRRTPVLSTPGVLSIVGIGGCPLPVDSSEIEAIQRVVSSQVAREPYAFLRTGTPVRVETGSLAGLKGTLIEIKRVPRLVLSVTLLQRSMLVEIDRESVSPLDISEKLVEPGNPNTIHTEAVRPQGVEKSRRNVVLSAR
jgi:transcription antitermination factor NusG